MAALNDEEDVDYFKFSLASKTTLNIRIPTPPTDLNPVVTVYNATQQYVSGRTGSSNQTVALNKLALEAGDYYVKVSRNFYYSRELYTLSVARDTLLPPVLSANKLATCPGGEVLLRAAECTGVVKWSTDQTGLSITVKPTANTSYTAVCEDGGRTSAASKPLAITMLAIPVATASASNSGIYYESQTIELTGGGGTSYAWTGPNNYRSFAQSPRIANALAGMTGDYVLTVTNGDGCKASATTAVRVDFLTSTEPVIANSSATAVFPNPSNGLFKVRVGEAFLLNEAVEIEAFDILGRSVSSQQSMVRTKGQTETIDLRGQANGMYFLRLHSERAKATFSILKR